jgi:hypothetical protein
MAAAFMLLGGCKTTRQQDLRDLSRSVGEQLKGEQGRALALAPADPVRGPRLSQLDTMRYTWSAANIALSSAPRFFDGPERELAFDVLEEVYGAIEWNLPKGPGDPGARLLPAGFVGNRLDLSVPSPLSPVVPFTGPGAGASIGAPDGAGGGWITPRGIAQ